MSIRTSADREWASCPRREYVGDHRHASGADSDLDDPVAFRIRQQRSLTHSLERRFCRWSSGWARIGLPPVTQQDGADGSYPLGELDGGQSQRSQVLAELMEAGGLTAPTPANIRGEIWIKLQTVCAATLLPSSVPLRKATLRTVRVVVYVVVVLVLRYMLHRMIDRASGQNGKGDDHGQNNLAFMRHLRGRMPSTADPKTVERRLQRAQTIGSVLKSTVSIVLLVWLILAVLNVLGVNIAPFIASAGVIGLAIGFGAQNLVRDLVSGVFMLLEDQYGVGDTIDLGEVTGEVQSVGLRITTLRDIDGTLWYVRNGLGNRVMPLAPPNADARVREPWAENRAKARPGRTNAAISIDLDRTPPHQFRGRVRGNHHRVARRIVGVDGEAVGAHQLHGRAVAHASAGEAAPRFHQPVLPRGQEA